MERPWGCCGLILPALCTPPPSQPLLQSTRRSPRPTETWLPSSSTLLHPCPLQQGKHRDAPAQTGAECLDPVVYQPGAGPTAPRRAARTAVFCPGSSLFSRGCCYYLAADFTQVPHPRLRGTNYFLAVCQERDGWKRLPPLCLLGQLKPVEPGGF